MRNNVLYIIIFSIILTACFDDDKITDSNSVELKLNSLILREAERRGDFINSSSTTLFPNYITAEELYNNINNYIIIDVRSGQDFSSGHIPNSINIQNTELFEYVNSISQSQNIVLISYSGQAASYYNALFRIYGLNNVYSLLFGIAKWNQNFQNEITDYIKSDTLGTDYTVNYPTQAFDLPELGNYAEPFDVQEIFNSRIKDLFMEGFVEKPDGDIQTDIHVTPNTINFQELYTNPSEYFVICYGTFSLYIQPRNWIGHPRGAYYFYPFAPSSDLASGYKLQHIPNNKKISIYSFSGHLSAMATAYLRLLGYDAKSILFGGISRSYSVLANDSLTKSFIYVDFKPKNYELE